MTKRRLAMERLLQVEPGAAEAPPPSKAPVRAGAVRTMGLALDEIDAKAAPEHTRGEAVVEIDPALCDPSFVRDRLEEWTPKTPLTAVNSDLEDAGGIAALAASIAEGGQVVPILVRPNPTARGRYQIAYGHRRWLACRQLNRPVRAVVRPLTDDELVIAQGRENNERRDLTFIERAMFAAALVGRGRSRKVAGAALGVDKSELARLLAVANGLPEGLALRIGRAPKAGRPRWLKLVALCRAAGGEQAFAATQAAAHLPSDERFRVVFKALSDLVTPDDGADLVVPVSVKRSRRTTVLTIDEKTAPDFGQFVEDRLPTLFRAYAKARHEL